MLTNKKIISISPLKALIVLFTTFLFLFSCNTTNVNNPYAEKRDTRADVYDFNSCVQAGLPVTRSFPPQCRTKDGRVFMNYTTNGKAKNSGTEVIERGKMGNCKDKCGDGTCQEIVCMAIGCPCAENSESCPKDCK